MTQTFPQKITSFVNLLQTNDWGYLNGTYNIWSSFYYIFIQIFFQIFKMIISIFNLCLK